jgi:ribonucleoside-diphosphate reductase alpha chain
VTEKKICSIDRQNCIAESRYYDEGEDWEKLCIRVTQAICEKEDEDTASDTYDMLLNKYFIPGGRILRNAGKLKRNLLNCFVIPIDDSIEAIADCMRDSLVTWAAGGGVGVNFSPLRPIGTKITGKGGESSGLVSFLRAMDSVADTIECGGQRRAACIAIIDIAHPEVEDFIDAKLKHGHLKNFNISIAINNDFLEALERKNSWDLKFHQKVYKTVDAQGLWNKILTNMIESAEPGLLNWDNLMKSNSYYFAPIIGTNPCGELPLSAYGSCDLGALNLPKFVTEKKATDWNELKNVIELAVRFLDNVIDVTTYPILQMKTIAEDGRRIGLGVLGLADYLFKKQIRYGSGKSNFEIETLFKFIRNAAYEASIKLAQEKFAFPKFHPVDYGKSSFVKKLPAKMRKKIKENGIRNVSLLTCAPTGTTSLVADVTSGIEPLFSKAYIRKDRLGDRIFIHPTYRCILKGRKKMPDWFVDAHDLTPEEHFETQAQIQKYIDGSISKTINLPSGTTVEQLSEWLMEYAWELKGVTVYVDKSRKEQVLYPITRKEAFEFLKKERQI